MKAISQLADFPRAKEKLVARESDVTCCTCATLSTVDNHHYWERVETQLNQKLKRAFTWANEISVACEPRNLACEPSATSQSRYLTCPTAVVKIHFLLTHGNLKSGNKQIKRDAQVHPNDVQTSKFDYKMQNCSL